MIPIKVIWSRDEQLEPAIKAIWGRIRSMASEQFFNWYASKYPTVKHNPISSNMFLTNVLIRLGTSNHYHLLASINKEQEFQNMFKQLLLQKNNDFKKIYIVSTPNESIIIDDFLKSFLDSFPNQGLEYDAINKTFRAHLTEKKMLYSLGEQHVTTPDIIKSISHVMGRGKRRLHSSKKLCKCKRKNKFF
jgi:hypothetical protein